MHFPAGAGPDAGLQRRVAGLPDVPVWTRSASHSGDGAHRSSAAHLVHARNEARRQREGVRGWEVVGTAPIFFWELSLRLWMTFKGFNPSAPILAAPSAEWGVRPPHEKDRQRCMLRPARRSPMPPTCPRTLEIGRRWPSLAVDSEAGSSTGRLQSSATIPYWTRS
jgi:hypothetical protein